MEIIDIGVTALGSAKINEPEICHRLTFDFIRKLLVRYIFRRECHMPNIIIDTGMHYRWIVSGKGHSRYNCEQLDINFARNVTY
jgi:hypothetical protein